MSEEEDIGRPQMQFPAVLSFYFQRVKYLKYSWPLKVAFWLMSAKTAQVSATEPRNKSKVIRFLICFCRALPLQGTVLVYVSSSRGSQSIAWVSQIFIKQVREIKHRVQSRLEIKYDCFNPPLQ